MGHHALLPWLVKRRSGNTFGRRAGIGAAKYVQGGVEVKELTLAHVMKFEKELAEAGIEPAVGSKGDSYDNALAETINGLYKAEVIHRRTWQSREAVEIATLEWVFWFNNHRLLEPLGYIPPVEAEANYYRQLAEQSAAVT